MCRLDVTKADQWKVIYDHCESAFKAPVELLVNNAGIAVGTDVQVIDVNLLGVVHGSTEFLARYGKSKVRDFSCTIRGGGYIWGSERK